MAAYNPPDSEAPPLPSLLERLGLTAHKDDWSGVSDPVRRRRLQNRANQKAHRRRRAILRQQEADSGVSVNELQQHNKLQIAKLPSSTAINQFPPTCSLSIADQHRALVYFEKAAYQACTLGSPHLDLLPTLVRFNVLRALVENTHVLGISFEWMEGDAVSEFSNQRLSQSPEQASWPVDLRPTWLQYSIEHHPWIDLLPVPRMRDNILSLGESYDDAPLCKDIVEVTSSPGDRAGLIIWGDPWDARNWEVSEEFLKKWSWVLRGCWELCLATNYWRAQRGERKLFPDVFCRPGGIQSTAASS